MAYFVDLSAYSYFKGDSTGAKNVGWLQRGYEFQTMEPSEEILDLLWSFCGVSVMQTRGTHQCDLCVSPTIVSVSRGGVERTLGSAEIRVFSKTDARSSLSQQLKGTGPGLVFLRNSRVPVNVYAAPNLIYHYVHVHHYKPPNEFLDALRDGPKPNEQDYVSYLRTLDVQ
ncbi:MAG: hypothetical protein DMG99_08790 [Acidobacteria bacterium]|jgi:hypothetical protein|nr:MAG: hypothetical protein DMG99_08790 [Acidobacteriota bacterium]